MGYKVNSTIKDFTMKPENELPRDLPNDFSKGKEPMTNRKSIVIIDSHRLFRDGIRLFIDQLGSFVVEGEADDYNTGLHIVKKLRPDIVITDISLPDINGIQLIHDIRKYSDEIQIMVVSSRSEGIYVIEALKAGAMGYVLKASGSSRLLNCLESVSNRKLYLDNLIKNNNISRIVGSDRYSLEISDPDYNSLTMNEQKMIRLFAGGLPVPVVSTHMQLSDEDVMACRKRIFRKLSFKNDTDVMKFAFKSGIINIDDW